MAVAESQDRSDNLSHIEKDLLCTPFHPSIIFIKKKEFKAANCLEIHDGIAQYISAAIMQLEASKANSTYVQKEDKDSNVNEALRLLRRRHRKLDVSFVDSALKL